MIEKRDLQNPLLTAWHFLRYLIAEFSANKGMLNAAALTYTTLFAVVPFRGWGGSWRA